MAFEEIISQLSEKKEAAMQMGGAARVEKHHANGKFTVRERIAMLLDADSFLEFGLLATSDIPGMEEKTPADGLICGYGLVDGRRVGVIANDFTVLASTNARINLKKMLQFKSQIKKNRVPLIWLGEAGGARMPDCQGSKNICTLGGGGTNTLFAEYTHFREMPFVMAAMGECYGVPDFEAMLADCVIQVKGSVLSISGPRALSRAIGQTFTGEEMGGWEIHDSVTGIADRIAEHEEQCFELIKEFLGYMPTSNRERPPRRPVPENSGSNMDKILNLLPEKRTRTYDMHKIIQCMVDGGKIFEIKPNFGKMLITCLARINGEVIGFIANNPIHNVGAMDTDGLEKHTSFLCLCDSFNIPLVFLHDTPGHMVGQEAERKRVGAKVANNLQALCQVTVPKIVIVIRKSYGQAAVNMCGPGIGPDYFVSWPTGELGFMEPTIAADVVFGKLPREERQQMLELMVGDSSPYPAAQNYFIQDIIDPGQTREYLTQILSIIRDSDNQGIGEHRLANWPTKF
ncbi:MAG: carboxyl transferase domain-containing protein [Thermodesulfobacteriota bacterium]|nr:carboxyl transferase domain-containing protein [Thermodesulfobacteriota bacterium]